MSNFTSIFHCSPHVEYRVLLDSQQVCQVKDYCVGAYMCEVWRNNNPREPKSRIALQIVPLSI